MAALAPPRAAFPTLTALWRRLTASWSVTLLWKSQTTGVGATGALIASPSRRQDDAACNSVPCGGDAPGWLRNFDTASPAEIRALPRRLRKVIIADRKRRVTAALAKFVAERGDR